MKLKFLQSGGTFNPRYSVYEPYIVPEEEISNSSASGGKKSAGSSTNSDILKMLKESFSNGLPSDLQAASTTIANVFSNIEKMINNPDVYGGTGSIASAYARALPLLKSIEFNSKEYESVYKSLNETGSMQEVAVNSMGQIAVKSDEGFGWVTPEEYHAHKDQFVPLSNALLLDQRANSTSLAFKNQVFETLKNGTSVDTITKQILESVSKVGSTEQIQTGYGYVSGGDIMKDFTTFSKNAKLEGFDPTKDDLYSYDVTTKSERENALVMIDIIYNMLPHTSKALLKYKSNGTDEGAKGMIALLAGTASDHSVKTGITLQEGYSKNAGKNSDSSSSSGGDKFYNPALRAAMGLGYTHKFNITPGTTNVLSVTGTSIPIMDSSSQMLQKDLLSDVKGTNMGQMLLTSDISVAGQHVDSSTANKIYLTDRRATLVDLPYRVENGHILPDYKLLAEKDAVEAEMEKNNWTFEKDYQKIQNHILLKNYTIKYDRYGKVIFDKVKQFALFDANVPEDVFPDSKPTNMSFLKELGEEASMTTYKAILQQNDWETKDWDFDVKRLWPNKIYKGTVAIPVDITYMNLVSKDLDAGTVTELMEKDKARIARNDWYFTNERAE